MGEIMIYRLLKCYFNAENHKSFIWKERYLITNGDFAWSDSLGRARLASHDWRGGHFFRDYYFLLFIAQALVFRTPFFLIWFLPRLWYWSLSGSISLSHLSIFYNISCYNSLILLTFVSRSRCRFTKKT